MTSKGLALTQLFMAGYVALMDGRPGAFGVIVPEGGGATVGVALRNAVEAATLDSAA
jgi:hypothetical protein